MEDRDCVDCRALVDLGDVLYWRKPPGREYQRLCSTCMAKLFARNLSELMTKAVVWAARPDVLRGEKDPMYPGWQEEFKRALGWKGGRDG